MNPACEHGILRRQCPYCERDELRREAERLREERDQAIKSCYFRETEAHKWSFDCDRYKVALIDAEKYLSEVPEIIEGWGGYASEYFQTKWHLDRDVQEAKNAHAAVVTALRGGDFKENSNI